MRRKILLPDLPRHLAAMRAVHGADLLARGGGEEPAFALAGRAAVGPHAQAPGRRGRPVRAGGHGEKQRRPRRRR